MTTYRISEVISRISEECSVCHSKHQLMTVTRLKNGITVGHIEKDDIESTITYCNICFMRHWNNKIGKNNE